LRKGALRGVFSSSVHSKHERSEICNIYNYKYTNTADKIAHCQVQKSYSLSLAWILNPSRIAFTKCNFCWRPSLEFRHVLLKVGSAYRVTGKPIALFQGIFFSNRAICLLSAATASSPRRSRCVTDGVFILVLTNVPRFADWKSDQVMSFVLLTPTCSLFDFHSSCFVLFSLLQHFFMDAEMKEVVDPVTDEDVRCGAGTKGKNFCPQNYYIVVYALFSFFLISASFTKGNKILIYLLI
jgi:hypothetical protein